MAALDYLAATHGHHLQQLRATVEVNSRRVASAVNWLRTALGDLEGRTICIAGIAFKPGTDDLRDSPSLRLARALAAEGATVTGFDEHVTAPTPHLDLALTLDAALRGADALVVAHQAHEVAGRDPEELGQLLRQRVLFDAAGALPPERWAAAGFVTNRPACPSALAATQLAD